MIHVAYYILSPIWMASVLEMILGIFFIFHFYFVCICVVYAYVCVHVCCAMYVCACGDQRSTLYNILYHSLPYFISVWICIIYVHECGHVCATVHMWRSEVNFRIWFLHLEIRGSDQGHQACAWSSIFTCPALLPTFTLRFPDKVILWS